MPYIQASINHLVATYTRHNPQAQFMCLFACMCACALMRLCVCFCVYVYANTSAHTCMNEYAYICMYVGLCVYFVYDFIFVFKLKC